MIVKKVIKRNGDKVEFDGNKIKKAIEKCMRDNRKVFKQKELLDIFNTVLLNVSNLNQKELDIEAIQDIVVETLFSMKKTDLFHAFVSYRQKRRDIRESNLISKLKELTKQDAEDNDDKRENGNVDGNSTMGNMLLYGSTVGKYLSLEGYSKKISEAHETGAIHIHDLDFNSTNCTTCSQIDIAKLFKNGFSTGHGFLREPSNIASASALVAIAIQSNQNDQFGGQAIPMLDYYLAPYLLMSYRKIISQELKSIANYKQVTFACESEIEKFSKSIDKVLNGNEFLELAKEYRDLERLKIHGLVHINIIKKLEREVFQAMEALVHNLNTLNSRAGSQTPFSSINFGTDISTEGRMVSEKLLLAQEAGLGKGETPIFPILIFKLKKGINTEKEDPNYDLFKLACRVSSKRLFPNFVNIDAPHNIQYYQEGRPETEAVSMGCVDGDETVRVIINNKKWDLSFSVFWNHMSYMEKDNFYYSEYINLENEDVKIFDSFNGKYVKVKKLIKNPDNVNYWFRIRFVERKTQKVKFVEMTENHPLPIVDKGRTLARDFENGDIVNGTNGEEFVITDMKWLGRVKNKFSYDVETESDRFDVSGIQSHNCRTRTIGDRHGENIVTGKGNLSFTTLNLPMYALRAKGDIRKFSEIFDEYIDLAIEQLLTRFKNQCSKTKKNFPMLFGQGIYQESDSLGEEESLYKSLRHGSLSVGFIGLAETLVALLGKHHGESKQAQDLGLSIIKHLHDRMNQASEEYDLNFGCLGTPAEGTCNRFSKILKAEFGIIKGITDKDFITNSFHVPVYHKISAYDKIKIEAPYHQLTPSGHITYVELDGNARNNVEAIETIVRTMIDAGIGYGSINHPLDKCEDCGLDGIIPEECPSCGSKKIDRIRRITGYLANKKRFNDGKRAEEKARVKHC